MNINTRLFTYHKNIDLHVVSAFEAITQLMGFDGLKRLRRFSVWDLDVEASSEENLREQVETVLQRSYYLLNPNKEGYFLGELPGHDVSSGKVELAEVTAKQAQDFSALSRKIRQKFGSKITVKGKSTLWELLLDDKAEYTQEFLKQTILVSRSRKAGLLLNPVSEDVRFLDLASHYVSQQNH